MSEGKDKKAPKAKKDDKALEKVDDDSEEGGKRGWKRWVFGWVITPGSILGGIFLGGVLVGAHTSESWFTRAILWIGDLF
jgi:hypothetical protein